MNNIYKMYLWNHRLFIYKTVELFLFTSASSKVMNFAAIIGCLLEVIGQQKGGIMWEVFSLDSM